MLTEISVLCLISYLVGSIPFGVILAKVQHVDIRKQGSGNIGATNVARVLGKKSGLLTLLGDVVKGLLVVLGASQFYDKPLLIALAGLMVFLGHLFSIFLKFQGGKGVATSLGLFSYIMPWATLCAVGVFASCLWISGYVSIGSIMAAISLPLFAIYFKLPLPYIYLAVIVGLFTLQRHHGNILRLIEGAETKFLKK
ncbi:MAG: glycerol-3-phosphate 1-O-acyltransferase PlsY [Nitrospina sp.]|jgi:glycerol-3-phosphate acyltransferase PlsY|nr:glycerol-3-phosphate 1-O-acyltransferase PlsY [Nitrospina sp.]MBT3511304.1 glycerol-3-phosphate 1-O-acyltransferase PlsY [Nitrospina sp.]MBT3875095.1 glycerol-3-phosphate 1-O-acyltransferase PlsY [Nitrospina sp.]MBT4047472.1 glycerol-3-phosphate 1-O-acyltransferase PlsY [Nitrospina sp.]MBT4558171.1 glycerol-3-phosphate 1-O-acyltransferase PlsY [Nitrospina sp.]